jgi:single-strand DNA-binding protein
MNSVTLVGRLGRDPQAFNLQFGLKAAFSIAVSKKKKVGDRWEEKTTWVDIECFSKTAEKIIATAKKGSLILICGELDSQKWNDKTTGQERTKLVVKASVAEVATPWDDPAKMQTGQGQYHQQQAQQRPAYPLPQNYQQGPPPGGPPAPQPQWNSGQHPPAAPGPQGGFPGQPGVGGGGWAGNESELVEDDVPF